MPLAENGYFKSTAHECPGVLVAIVYCELFSG